MDALATAIIPDNVSFTSAAVVPSAGLTAYLANDRKLQVTSSDTVLITGAGGGVGGFAAQLAASRGAHVIEVASGKHEDRVRPLGAHEFIDYRTTDVGDRVREITDGQGVDAVLDVVGTDSATEKLHLLAFGGRIATAAGDPDFSEVNSLDTGLSWFGLATGLAYLNGDDSDVEELGLMLEELFALIRAGDVDPMVTSTIGLDEVPHRLAEMAEGKSGGKTAAVL